jgi:curli biogenesis system outer membrane secretion channel CsgG
MRNILFLGLMLFLLSAVSYGQEKKSPVNPMVAVYDFSGNDRQKDVIRNWVEKHVVNTGAFRVVERGQMNVILEEQGLISSGACDEGECNVEIGRLLGADYIISGEINMGTSWSLSVRMTNVETGEIYKMHEYTSRKLYEEAEAEWECRNAALLFSGEETQKYTPKQEWYRSAWAIGSYFGAAAGIVLWLYYGVEVPRDAQTTERSFTITTGAQ